MKLNGKNIILDDDVTMTGKNLGEKLSDVVGELQSKTSKLENYLKWIYKYGGVGGSGGNGGGSSTYSLYAELAGVALAGQNISLGSAGVYTLYFKISRPEGATFNVTYEYTTVKNSVATTIKKKVTLDVSNSYEYSVNLELNSNATIFVTAVDSIYNETKQLSAKYITKSYEFGIRLANNNEETLNNEIFTTTAEYNGLNVFLDYEIAVSASINYSLSFNTPDKKSIVVNGYLDQNAKKKDKIQFNLVEIGREEGWEPEEKNSGYYSGQVTVNINIEGQGIKTETFPFNFTLIPQDLYLLVQPAVGNIYTSEIDSDIYEYTPGNISFNLKAYYGTQIESDVVIDYYLEKDDESPAIGQVISKLRDRNSIRIYSTKTGWNKIRFQLRCLGVYYPERNEYVDYYFYIKQSDTNIDWYDSTRSGIFNYCRGDSYLNLQSFYKLTTGAPYQQTINKSELELTDLVRPLDPGTKYNTNIALGIMYSEINSDDSTILKCIQTVNGRDTVQVEVTQNTVKVGDNMTINYYLPKTENYHAEGFNYHVLNIVSRLVSNDGTTDYYEILVYIDGKIEGALQSYSRITLGIDKLVIGKSNCMINMLEVSYLNTVYEDKKSKVEDLTIYQYYLKYKSVFGGTISDDEVALIGEVGKFTVDNNSGDVYCEGDTVRNISQLVEIPTLLIKVNDSEETNWKPYLDKSFNEEEIASDIEATLEWSGGKGKGVLSTVDSPANTYFTITVQGSSTRAYKCKNYDLTIHNRDKSENALLYLYSPNFSNTDTSTFLPEQTFTLKADVVDSSHSNNTSIGKFVNAITAPFDTNTKQSGILRGHIKNCLDGFPVLVYIQFVRKDKITGAEVAPCYFQGVYNFNLGRKSFYNLGYKDSSVFCNPNGSSKLRDAGNNFIFYDVKASEDHLKNGVIVAEVQGNSPYFDFSQWDETILYNYYNNNKETYMFGDLVNGSNLSETESKKIIQNLVNHVALAGGYLFGDDLMKKSFSESEDDHYGYDAGYNAVGTKIDRSGNTLENVPLNQVPNYRKQFKKKLDSGGNQIYSVYTTLTEDGTYNNLEDILGNEDENKEPWFDYRSLSEYYTICMAFGLVDSVQKNLNIKSWNADPSRDSGKGYAKFYAAFYDMDTCLGINNKGTDVSYFAFSDYWGYNDIENPSGSITPTYVTIYRDYSPRAGGDSSDFYDTASSYLFAIAKYARYKNKTETTFFWPKELWAKWRGSRTNSNDPSYGCLRSAKTFIDNYFANNLGKVPAALINANYRNKYLIIDTKNKYSFSQINWEKFNGTRIAKAEDWLEGRFHILDAYFNLPDANSPIQHWEKKRGTKDGVEFDYDDYTAITSNGAIINDPEISGEYYLKANTDIFVLQDIFSGSSNNQGSGTLNINIKAREYSPLIAEIANNIYRYLLGGEKLYNIVIPLNGMQTYKFNGSGAWTELDSINTFNFSNLQVNSKYLETLSGNASNSMTVAANSLNMPSLKTLVLSSNTYTGNLVLDGTNFPNLGSVDVSNSSISLDISNSDLTRVNIANMTGPSASVSVRSCKSLQEIIIGNTTLGSCTINPLPVELATTTDVGERSFGSGGFEISNTKITSLSLTNSKNTNSKNTGGNTRLSITNDASLTELSVSGFATVYIENCPKLINIYITDPQNNGGEITGDYLEKLYIDNCGDNNNNFRIGTANTALRVADLTAYTELKYLKISNCIRLEEVKFINDSDKYIDLAPEAFRGDTNLKFINGTSSVWITGRRTFFGCKAFTLKQNSGAMSNIWVRDYVTDLLSTFYVSNGSGAITRDLAKTFIERRIPDNNNIENISYMFRGQNITYTKDNLISDLKGQKGQAHDYIDMSRLKKVTSASYAFGWNDISAWHRKWYSFGSEVTNIGFSSYMVTSSRTIYTTLDVYEDIIDKVDVLGWQQSNGVDLYPELHFVDSEGNIIADNTDINLAELFHPGGKHPDNCKTLRYMDFSNKHNLSLSGVFENWPALEKIERFMFKREYTRCKDLDRLLSPLTNLKYVKDSFRISAIVNLANFCNWEALKHSTSDPFQSRTVGDANYNLGNFTIQKYITVGDFNELIGTTIGDPSCNWTGISNLFRNCTLITNSDDHKLSLGNNINRNIIAIDGTFYNFRVVKMDGGINPSEIPNQTSTYVTLSDNLLRIFPNLTSAGYTFYGMKIANQLPYNFFGKRNETTADIYIMDENSRIPDKGKNKYEESVYGDYFIPAKLYSYDYKRQLINLRYCFKYVKWKQDTTNGVNARSFYPTTIDENRIVLSDGSGTVIKVIKTEGLYYFKKVTETTYDSEGNPKSETYFKRSEVPFRRSTEITDTENLQEEDTENLQEEDTENLQEEDTKNLYGKYAETITGYDYDHRNKFTNYYVYKDALTHCFVAPDILYGVTSSCNIDGVFDSTEDGENLETLEGIIPANLLKNCMSSSFPNLMRNLNIIPNYFGEYKVGDNIYKIYNYIPENFTSTNVLDNAFNFHFLLPPAKTVNTDGVTTYYKHYLLLNSSVTSDKRGNVSSINFGVPSVYYNDSKAGKGLYVDDNVYFFPNTHMYDYGVYYNLMFKPSYDSTGSLVGGEEGIDMTSYSALNLDNLLSPIISFFMSGRLFNSSFLLNNAKKNKENYIIDTFQRKSDDYVVSMNIIFPQASGDFNGKNIFNCGSTTLELYSSQVSNDIPSKEAYKTITIGNDSTGHITFKD